MEELYLKVQKPCVLSEHQGRRLALLKPFWTFAEVVKQGVSR